jgi:hypothetical protein
MPKGKYDRSNQTWVCIPEETLRAEILRASREILAAGQRVSRVRLGEYGVRGAVDRIIRVRKELVASGDLPPEAAAREYDRTHTERRIAPQPHPQPRSELPAPAKKRTAAELSARQSILLYAWLGLKKEEQTKENRRRRLLQEYGRNAQDRR